MSTTEMIEDLDATSRADQKAVLFFDGVCGLCNYFVDFALIRDQQERILFAPIQGETAETELTEAQTENLETVILKIQGKTYLRSSAVVRLLWQLSGVYPLLGTLLWLIPKPFRDLGYQLVASNRYRIFGQKESCRLPTKEEASRFLP